MIILCPKAFAGKELMYERRFVRHYIAKTGEKGMVCNKTWSSFRWRITNTKDPEVAEKIITNFRGSFTPENMKLTDEFQEQDPLDCDLDELIESTKDLVNRKWADIDYFIVQDETDFQDTKVKPITLSEFFVQCMQDDDKRHIVEDFMIKEVRENMLSEESVPE